VQRSSFRAGLALYAIALGTAAVAAPANQFISTWKAPGAGPINFAGRKVAAVLITDDDSLRVPAEEALAREISARGPTGVPAYRVIPREEVKKKDAAKAWFERASVDGLVVLRLVKTDTEKVYSSFVWSSGYYNNAWDYWDAGWASVYPIGKGRDQITITVETLLYDLKNGTPIWAAASRTVDPKDIPSYMKGLAADIVKQLEKDGLIRKGAR
jgi:hypothetical protein